MSSLHRLKFNLRVYKAHRFDLRFLRPFRADLSIRKSSSFFPPLIASTSHLGFAPRPAQVSPERLRYFGGTSTASNDPSAANYGDPLQLLFEVGTMLMKGFVNPPSQVHERFNSHS